MKKLLFPILFLLLVVPAMSQGLLLVNGTVTDLSNGNPIPNHAVIIHNDSTAGWYFYHTVYTNSSGYFSDSIAIQNGGTQGNLYVGTVDCQNYLNVQSFVYSPANTSFTATFAICYSNNPCQAAFNSQQQQPLVVNFYDSSVGGQNFRQWSFGDGSTSGLMNPVHTYTQPGYYAVSLTIGALGTPCYNTVTQTVYVWDSIIGGGCQAAFTLVPDSTAPFNTYQFIDQSAGNIVSWTWNFGDGMTSNLQNPVHIYAQQGIYGVCLTIQGADSACFDVTCDTLIVGVPPACHAAFTYYGDSLNSGNTLHFIDESTGNIVSWNWNFGDGNTSFEQNPVHTYAASGYYMVTLTVGSPNQACFDVTSDTVTIGSGGGCQAYFSYATAPASGYSTVSFTDLSTGNPTSWLWSFGDGTSGTMQNPIHNYTSPGSYNVCLTIAGNNCTSTFCQIVVIQDSVNYHQIYGQVFEGNFPLPLGMAMIFSVDTNANYQPFVAVCPIDSNGVYYFTMVPDGNYYIMAIPFDSNGYLPTYYGNTISWEQATLISMGVENNPYNINLVPSDQMTPGPGSTNGQINLGDMYSSMMDKINMILLNEQGNAIGFTRVTSAGGFSFPTLAYGTYFLHAEMPGVTSDMVKIILTPENPHSDVVMTFSGNTIQGTRDEVTLANRWIAYPNPVIDNLTVNIDMKQGTKAGISVYNLTGQLVESSQITLTAGNNTVKVSVASLPDGIYTMRIFTQNGEILATKLVKTK